MTNRRFIISVIFAVLVSFLLLVSADGTGFCLNDDQTSGCIADIDEPGPLWVAILASQLFGFPAIGYFAGAFFLFGGKRPALIDLAISLGLLAAAATFGEMLVESAYFRLVGQGEGFADYTYFTYFLTFAAVFGIWGAMNAVSCAIGGTAAYLLSKKEG
ncbi:MAG: hypothetical protein AB1324_01155 [Candidatus Micrarchaeota archaeon]